MNINEEKGKIVMELKSRKDRVRCPICNKFKNSVHGKFKSIRNV